MRKTKKYIRKAVYLEILTHNVIYINTLKVVKVLGTPVGGQGGVLMDPDSENAFPKKIMTKLGIYQDFSKSLLLTKEKLENNVWFRK